MIDATDKNWHIDQWIYNVDLYGEVTQVTRATTVKTANGQVIENSPEVLDNANPTAQAKYKALIKFWSEFQPQETNQ